MKWASVQRLGIGLIFCALALTSPFAGHPACWPNSAAATHAGACYIFAKQL